MALAYVSLCWLLYIGADKVGSTLVPAALLVSFDKIRW